MSAPSANQPDARAPFGTRPGRPRTPLVSFILAYAVWFAFLVWLALFATR